MKGNKNKSKANKENSHDEVHLNGEKRNERSSRGENTNIESYINIPEPPNGPTYYREKLQTETRLLMGLADELSAIRASTAELPETVSGDINSVVCGIKLMVSSKFELFRGLVDDCAARFRVLSRIPRPLMRTKTNRVRRLVKPPVKPEDLDGFWEVMNLHIDEIKKGIANLQELRENNWKPKKTVKPRQATPAKWPLPCKRPAGKSKFRQFLRKKQEAKTGNEVAASAAKHVEPNDSSEATERDTLKSLEIPQKLLEAGKNSCEPINPDLAPAPLTAAVEADVSSKNADQGYQSFFCSTPSVSISGNSLYQTPLGSEFTLFFNPDVSSPIQRSLSSANLHTGPERMLIGHEPRSQESITESWRNSMIDIEDAEVSRLKNAGNWPAGLPESLITPRAAQNMMIAVARRRSSINVICQRAILARAMSNMEVNNEDESNSPLDSHCRASPISEGSPPTSE